MFLMNFVTILMVSVAGWSFDPGMLGLQMACRDKEKCSDEHKKVLDKVQLSCELELQAQNCEGLAKENPEWAPLMRRCDYQSMCAEQSDYMANKSKACLRGYKNAMIDLGISIKDMSLSLADFVDSSWESFKTNQKQRNEFVKECNKSVSCKRDLVKDDHRYNNMTDDQLDKYTAAFLYVESRDMASYKSSLDRVRPKPYVPLSERPQPEILELSKEQENKLASLANAIGSKVKEQYSRYSCYTPTAKEELECYAIGTVIDPTLLAGYFVKGARAAHAVHGLSKVKTAGTELRAGEVAADAGAVQRLAVRENFVKKYVSYSPTTPQQNASWIATAEKGVNSKTKFLDVENSQMKALNDTLKNKNLVTSVTNYQKELLFKKIEDLEKEFPGLKIEKYSDFKSSRFAFSGDVPADLDARLAKIFKETNDEMTAYLKKENIIRQTDASEQWFRAGVGNSADQANLAARFSRQQQTNELQGYAGKELQASMSAKVSSIESQRQVLQKELSQTSVFNGSTLDQDAFDIVRKGAGDVPKINQELKARYGLSELSTGSTEKIIKYSKEVDEFSPGIYIAKREFASLDEAVNGGVSADIIGLGSANLRGTAEALAKSSTLEKSLVESRAAEKLVTENFKKQKAVFEETIVKAAPGKLKTVCSGDDCVAVATAKLSTAEKSKIVGELAKTEYAGKYRLAFVSDGVKDAQSRTMLTTHGEGVEKVLRKELGTVMEPRKLKGLTFATDMQTTELNRGPVKLLIGEANGVKLSTSERKLIQEKFNQALKNLNGSLQKQGKTGAYTDADLGGW